MKTTFTLLFLLSVLWCARSDVNSLEIARTGGDLTITWTNGNAVLQASPDLLGPWSDITGASLIYATSLTNSAAFFRLRAPANSGYDGAVFYVDNTKSDANDGLTPATAFRTVARGLSSLTNHCMLRLTGGQSFSESNLTLYADGTLAHPIIVTASGNGSRATIISTNSHGLRLAGANLVVSNLVVVGNTNWVADSTWDNFNPITGIKIDSTNKSGIWISDCEIYQWPVGVIAQPGDNANRCSDVVVSNCAIHDCSAFGISTGVDNALFGGQGGTSGNIIFSNFVFVANTISNIYGVAGTANYGGGIPIAVFAARNSMVSSNTCHDGGMRTQSSSGGGAAGVVFMVAADCQAVGNEIFNMKASQGTVFDGSGIDMDAKCTNCSVFYNYCHDNEGAGFYMWNSVGPSNRIFFNVACHNGTNPNHDVVHKSELAFSSNLSIGGQTTIFNNTLLATVPGNTAFFAANTFSSGTNIVANNIFYADSGNCVNVNSSAIGVGLAGNDYWRGDGAATMVWHGTTDTGLSDFRGNTGQELGTGFSINPNLNSLAAVQNANALTIAAITNYRLTGASGLLGQGLDLNTIFGIAVPATDFAGNPLPASGYSIGACNQPYP